MSPELLSGTLAPGNAGSFIGNVVSGAVTNAVVQGIAVATGLQDKFDWAGVAAAGIAHGVSTSVSAKGLFGIKPTAGSFGSRALSGAASAIASAATRSAISGDSFGDSLRMQLPSLIGQLAGTALGEQFDGRSGGEAGAAGGQERRKSGGLLGAIEDALSLPGRVAATVGRQVAEGVADVGDAVGGVFKSIDSNLRSDRIIENLPNMRQWENGKRYLNSLIRHGYTLSELESFDHALGSLNIVGPTTDQPSSAAKLSMGSAPTNPAIPFTTTIPDELKALLSVDPKLAAGLRAFEAFAEENTFPKDMTRYLDAVEIAYSVIRMKDGSLDWRAAVGKKGIGEVDVNLILPRSKDELLVAAGHSHNGIVRSLGFMDKFFLNYKVAQPGPSPLDQSVAERFPNSFFFLHQKTYGSPKWQTVYFGPKSLGE